MRNVPLSCLQGVRWAETLYTACCVGQMDLALDMTWIYCFEKFKRNLLLVISQSLVRFWQQCYLGRFRERSWFRLTPNMSQWQRTTSHTTQRQCDAGCKVPPRMKYLVFRTSPPRKGWKKRCWHNKRRLMLTYCISKPSTWFKWLFLRLLFVALVGARSHFHHRQWLMWFRSSLEVKMCYT